MLIRNPLLRVPVVLFLLSPLATGCTAFATVRPARVEPGISGNLAVAATSNPGDDAAWFWTYDCASECGRPLPGYELAFYHGVAAGGRTPAFELGAGLNGLLYPFAQGYFQLNGAQRRPWGLGLRLGVPAPNTWHAHQLFGRIELAQSARSQLVFQPALLLHTGNSPNGANPGTFIGLIPALGLHTPGHRLSGTLSISPVLGWTQRQSAGVRINWSRSMFATAAASITWHRRR